MSLTMHQEHELRHRALLRMRDNYDDTVATIPNWQVRLSEGDRRYLLQALSDLEYLLGIVG